MDMVAGWWLTYPSEKYELVNWDDYSQYMGNKKCSKPPISYMIIFHYNSLSPDCAKGVIPEISKSQYQNHEISHDSLGRTELRCFFLFLLNGDFSTFSGSSPFHQLRVQHVPQFHRVFD